MDRPPRQEMHCPHCGEGNPRMVQQNEYGWHCDICGKSWKIAPIDELDVRDVNGVEMTDP